MSRKIKFPLKMADGAEVRTLDELKEHFDIKSVVAYFKDGRLLNWLQARYYYDEADKIEQLTDDETLTKNLCAIFGVESETEELNVEEIARRQERLNKLKQYTDDRDILERVDLVAFDQEELSDLFDEDATLIYLCNNRFTIPLRVEHKNYVGVGKAVAVIRSDKIVDFDALNIKFKNVIFDDNYAALLKERELAEENKIAAEKRRAEEAKRAEEKRAEEAKLAEEAARPKKLFDEGNAALENEDYETALEKFKASADLGYSRAFSSVASIYYLGEGVDKNISEARRWYKLGMEKNDGDSFGGYAMSLLYEGEPTEADKREAFRCMKRATELEAASEDIWWDELGDMYRDGTGTKENPREAIRCYEKGVELGNSYSAISLGDFFFYGKYVDQNYFKAFKFCKQAVDLDGDNIIAVKNLAYCYRRGYGTAEDSFEAFKLYKQAAQAGDVDAYYYLGDMYFKGEGVHEDKQEAVKWMSKAAEAGDVQGMKNLAYCYKEGVGIPKNLSKSIEWYTKAAEDGDSGALCSLGKIYCNGDGVLQDFYKAAAYFKQATEQGNGDAMNQLALMYDKGQGVAKDLNLSFQWFSRAAEAGSADGMSNLSLCYLWGDGVSADFGKAQYWMNKAAEAGNYNAMLRYADKIYAQNKLDSRLIEMYTTVANAGYGEAAYRLSVMYRKGYGTVKNPSAADYWTRKYKEFGYTPDQNMIDAINNGGNGNSNSGNSNSGGGCFITTAVCENFGKPDDCYELTTFRKFRDGWLTAQPDGKSLIAEYYATAPAIVDKINNLPNAAQVYDNIRRKYLIPCLKFIEQGDNQTCKRLYVEMVTSLKKKFLEG